MAVLLRLSLRTIAQVESQSVFVWKQLTYTLYGEEGDGMCVVGVRVMGCVCVCVGYIQERVYTYQCIKAVCQSTSGWCFKRTYSTCADVICMWEEVWIRIVDCSPKDCHQGHENQTPFCFLWAFQAVLLLSLGWGAGRSCCCRWDGLLGIFPAQHVVMWLP